MIIYFNTILLVSTVVVLCALSIHFKLYAATVKTTPLLKGSVAGLCSDLSSVWCCVNQWDAICWGKSTANQMCWGWMEDVLPWITLYGCFCSTPSKWINLVGILFSSKQEVFPCDYYSLRQPERGKKTGCWLKRFDPCTEGVSDWKTGH